jgi:predicted ATPase/tRNA A-37 threonylcarbamoyl transferase component Bud32
MKTIQDYEILEKIEETTGSLIYRGRKSDGNETVILKVLKTQLPSPSEIARFKQEYDIIKNLNSDDIIKTLDILYHESTFLIVLEDFNGVSISRIIENGYVFDIKTFLKIGIKISNAIGLLHKNDIIHKDIKPANILFNQNDGRIKITDFGISSVITHENEQIYNPDVIQGSLLYMSPEQTGRMNRMVDYRTDIYSLGVTFYKMLSGNVPFESNDPLEIIHSHIAKEPIPLFQRNSEIPKIISDIIQKVMSKNPEDRYQSCLGISFDLQKCFDTLEPDGKIKPFELAKYDISGKFLIPQKVFGRQKEIDVLLSSLDGICKSEFSDNTEDSIEFILVSGNPGIGKSALINEIIKPVARKNGYFLSGKYEQFRGDTPFSAIIHAFQKFLKLIAAGNQEKIIEIKKDILGVLGQNGKIITDLIPELEMIIGRQPDVIKLGSNETRNRFNIVFINFIGVFATTGHPLIIFLDDLQWADIASIQLITNLINSGIKHLLLIGSYRDNEISDTHPLDRLIKHINESNIRIKRIQLSELKIIDIKDLIVNFFKCTEEHGTRLAEIVFRKTGGNPFFVNEFLHTLYNEKELEFDPYSGWKWEMDKISGMNITENVVEFLSGKIKRLPVRLQEVLKICACIGNRFDLESLSVLISKSIDDTLGLLSEVINESYINNMGQMYFFNHDRIQEAAYSLLSENEKPSLHYTIGKLMLEKTDIKELNKKLLYITDQLNLGRIIISDTRELENLAHLNYNCGIKSKASSAFFPAFKYFQTGINILGEEAWEKNYDLILALYSEATEAAYLNGDYEEMEKHAATVIANARNIYDAIPVYESKILTYDALGHFQPSIGTCLDVLKKLNYSLPGNPGRLRMKFAFLTIRPYLHLKGIDSLLDLPDVKDQRMILVFKIFSYLTRSALYINPDLCFYSIIEMIKLSFKYGKYETQPVAYIRMANLLINVLGDIDTGYRLGNIGLRLVEKFNTRNYEASVYAHYYLFIAHWKEHFKSVMAAFMKAYYIGMETGDIQSSSLCLILHDGMLINTGTELNQAERQMSRDYSTLLKLKQAPFLGVFCIFWQLQLILLGRTDYHTELTGTVFNKDKITTEWKKNHVNTPMATFHVTQLMLRYIFNEYEKAKEDADAAVKYLGNITGGLAIFDYCFYSSLAILACFPAMTRKEKKEYLKLVNLT